MKKFSYCIWLFSIIFSTQSYGQQDIDLSGSIYSSESQSMINNQENTSSIEFEIINAFPAPLNHVGNLSTDGVNLILGSLENGKIYIINPENGIVIDTFSSQLESVGGIACTESFYFVAENNGTDGKEIHKIDKSNFNTIDIFYHDLGDFTHGMQYLNGNLYVNMFYLGTTDTTFILGLDGEVLDKIPNHFTFSHGLTYDNCKLWISTNTQNLTSSIYRLDPINLEVLDTIATPGGAYPNGLTWLNNSLWVANNESDSIFQLAITGYPIDLSLTVDNQVGSLTATAGQGGYQWLDCDNDFEQIIGETNSIFVPGEFGAYAVEINSEGCIDTSECIQFNITNINESGLEEISIFYNEVSNSLSINLNNFYDDFELTILSVDGKIISKQKLKNISDHQSYLQIPGGLYVVHLVLDDDKVINKKLMIKH